MEKELIPQLRFPEFNEKWNIVQLGRLGSFQGGGTPSTNNSDYWAGNIPWVSSSDITEKDIFNLTVTRYLSKEAVKESSTKIIPKNSILFVARVGVGKLAVANVELCTSQDFANLTPKKDSSHFIAYYFLSKNKLLYQYAQGTSIKGFTMGDLKSIPINIPSLPEQQKIAAFLSDVDKKITKLTKKAALLEQYKKGIMQKIFNQELRFKDDEGNEFPEWIEKKYNDIYTFYSTNSLSREKLNYESGDIYNIHYGDIHTKFSTLFNLGNELVPFVNKGVDLSKIKEESFLRIGDLLIADASEDYTDIGKTIEVVNLKSQKVISGLHTFHARPNKFKMATGFAGYMLQTWKVRKQVMKIAQGTKVLSLSTTRLGEIILSVPTVSEQAKIANFLSDIDIKIEALHYKIENTQAFKKALLQQMFV